MRNLLFALFLCLPFLVSAQQNKMDSFTSSFTCLGYMKDGKFIEKLSVIEVDFYTDSLFVAGGGYSFEILGKKPLLGYLDNYLTFVKLDNGQLNTLVTIEKSGAKIELVGLYCPKMNIHYSIDLR